jgi:SAM-dependent methyltransferase
MSTQQHKSDTKILDRRTLQNDHRALVGILLPGMSVLDVGCGTGAITKGIAEVVGIEGKVLGLDRDKALVERAMLLSQVLPNLSFKEGDATSLGLEGQFDVVTSARTLQWIKNVGEAISGMARAAKPGGFVVVLDYNHSLNSWAPDPPPAFLAFYNAFLEWRRANQWDNEMGNRLPALFRDSGLVNIEVHQQDEVADSGNPGFSEKTALWTEVIDKVASNLQTGGFATPDLLQGARNAYEVWRKQRLTRQTLSLTSVIARVPPSR